MVSQRGELALISREALPPAAGAVDAACHYRLSCRCADGIVPGHEPAITTQAHPANRCEHHWWARGAAHSACRALASGCAWALVSPSQHRVANRAACVPRVSDAQPYCRTAKSHSLRDRVGRDGPGPVRFAVDRGRRASISRADQAEELCRAPGQPPGRGHKTRCTGPTISRAGWECWCPRAWRGPGGCPAIPARHGSAGPAASGDTVALMMTNRPESHLADTAACDERGSGAAGAGWAGGRGAVVAIVAAAVGARWPGMVMVSPWELVAAVRAGRCWPRAGSPRWRRRRAGGYAMSGSRPGIRSRIGFVSAVALRAQGRWMAGRGGEVLRCRHGR